MKNVLFGGGAGATYAYVRACDNASVAYKRLRQAALCRHRYPAHACWSYFLVRSAQLEGELLTTCRSQTLPVDTRYCEPITRSRGVRFAYKADFRVSICAGRSMESSRRRCLAVVLDRDTFSWCVALRLVSARPRRLYRQPVVSGCWPCQVSRLPLKRYPGKQCCKHRWIQGTGSLMAISCSQV